MKNKIAYESETTHNILQYHTDTSDNQNFLASVFAMLTATFHLALFSAAVLHALRQIERP